jgi:hypothetical protein
VVAILIEASEPGIGGGTSFGAIKRKGFLEI